MINVYGIEFVPYQGCPLQSIDEYTGFEITNSGMEIYVASGTCTGTDVAGDPFYAEVPAASGLVVAPASGQTCFGFWAKTDGQVYFSNDTSTDLVPTSEYDVVVVKALWGYVDAGDTTLDGKTVCINW